MKKTNKTIAILAILMILASSFISLLNGVTYAVTEDVTVVIRADSDNKITLSDGVENGNGQLERNYFNIHM